MTEFEAVGVLEKAPHPPSQKSATRPTIPAQRHSGKRKDEVRGEWSVLRGLSRNRIRGCDRSKPAPLRPAPLAYSRTGQLSWGSIVLIARGCFRLSRAARNFADVRNRLCERTNPKRTAMGRTRRLHAEKIRRDRLQSERVSVRSRWAGWTGRTLRLYLDDYLTIARR